MVGFTAVRRGTSKLVSMTSAVDEAATALLPGATTEDGKKDKPER